MKSTFTKSVWLSPFMGVLMFLLPIWSAAGESVSNPSEPAAELGAANAPAAKKWALKLQGEEKLAYKGVVNYDGAGMGQGTMMYPAPNAIGLVAAILTHAALVENSKQRQKDKMQEEADKVLLPYREVIDSYTSQDLMLQTMKLFESNAPSKKIDFSGTDGSDWRVEALPVFSLTQDQKALILDSSFSLTPPVGDTAQKSELLIRVISMPRDEEQIEASWKNAEGTGIKQESANLLYQALNVALAQQGLAQDNAASFKTVRYLEGGKEKMERAQVLAEHCDRVVIKTLRGNLMSVPAKRKADTNPGAAQCDNKTALK